MTPPAGRTAVAGWLASAWLLGASFLFYVTFVQYGLLRHARLNLGLAESDLMPGFGLLAGLGIAGSLLAGRLIDRWRPAALRLAHLTAALSGLLAAVAFLSLLATNRLQLILCFAPLGLLLGLLIVVLLHLFTVWVPADVRGWCAGGAAAFVYLAANVIAIFSERPDIIGWFDILLIAGNIAVVGLNGRAWRQLAPVTAGREIGLWAMLRGLWPLALVVLIDTALFVLVSRDPGPTAIFAGPGDWLANGGEHFLAALLAGGLYTRLGWRKITRLAAAALAVLVVLFAMHRGGVADLSAAIQVVYSLVVGFYTVSLFTLFGEEIPRGRPALGIAAGMVFVGWLASPAGIALGTALLPR